MVIWIFNHYATIPTLAGGTRHYDLAKELIKKGHAVTIFASSFDHPTRTEKHIHNPDVKILEQNIEGIRFIWIKTTPYQKNDWRRVLNMLSYSVRAYFYAKKLSEKPDVVIGSLMHPFAALIGYMVARKKKSLFYFEERDLWPQTLIDLGKVSAKHPVVKVLSCLERFLYRKAHRIIVLFDKAVDYVESQGISRNKVLYLPNGVDLDRFKEINLHLPKEHEDTFNQLKGKFIVMYTGAHGLANNLDPILDIAKIMEKKFTDIHFLFVGEGSEKERLLHKSIAYSLNNVTFLPGVPKNLIPSLLSRGHIGIISLKDTKLYKWGISLNKMFDYMAAGLPIVMLSSLKNTIIEQYQIGIKAQDINEAANAIENLYVDEHTYKVMKQNALHFVEQYHSWDNLAQKLLNVLEQDVMNR